MADTELTKKQYTEVQEMIKEAADKIKEELSERLEKISTDLENYLDRMKELERTLMKLESQLSWRQAVITSLASATPIAVAIILQVMFDIL